MLKFTERFFYYFFKSLFSLGLRVYYKKITVYGKEKVPKNSSFITTSNHPTGLMDVFLASKHIKRQIKFTAAGSLFKDKLQAVFLTSVGTIPVYRRKDSPGEMDKNVESFELCFRELEGGGAIGFYPEGTSHPEPWVNPIKTGAARIALQAEDRNNFNLRLKIIPIGINSPDPGAFRGETLVNIGTPITLEKYRDLYQRDSIAAVEQLTEDIYSLMQSCTLHIKDDLLLNLVEALKTIGFDEVTLNDQTMNSGAAKFYFIAKSLEKKFSQTNDDEKVSWGKLVKKTGELSSLMKHFKIADHPFKGIVTIFRFISMLIIAVLGLPIAIISMIVNILPFLLAKKIGEQLAGKDISLIPAGRLMMGTVIFLLYYLLLCIIIGCFIGLIDALLLSFFFLVSGYLTLWYWEGVKVFIVASRKIYLWLNDRKMIKELIKRRNEIIDELNKLLDN